MTSACSLRDPKEMFALKQKAIKYYQNNGVCEKMEEILNSMFYEDPADVYGHLVNFFSQFTKPATLKKVTSQLVFDSTGQPTLQTHVYCTVNNKEKFITSSTIPNGEVKASPEENEKVTFVMQESVKKAIEIINTELGDLLMGLDPLNQSEVDEILQSVMEKKKEDDLRRRATEEENQEKNPPPLPPADEKDKKKSVKKGRKSSIAIDVVPDRPPEIFTAGKEIVPAISQAVCACAASLHGIPTYRHIANIAHTKGAINKFRIPLPMVTIVQSGKQAMGKVQCIKEYMVVPGTDLPIDKSVSHIQNIYNHVAKFLSSKMGVAAKYMNDTGALCPAVDVPTQILDLLQEAINAEDLTIGKDMHIAINAAAHECFDYEKGKYEIVTGSLKSPDEMVEFWADLVTKYPSICAIIDPFRGSDVEAWMKLCERVSEACFIVGDHFYNRPGVLRKEFPAHIQTSGIVFKLEQTTSISDITECANKFGDAKNEVVIATSHGDTADTFIVDLAVGINARFLKIGGPCRGEKSCKLNRLIEILSELEPPEVTNEAEDSQGQEDKEHVRSSYSLGKEDIDVMLPNISENDDAKEEEVVCEEKSLRWGEYEKCCLLLHSPFLFPLVQNPPPPPEEAEEEKDKEETSASPPSTKREK